MDERGDDGGWSDRSVPAAHFDPGLVGLEDRHVDPRAVAPRAPALIGAAVAVAALVGGLLVLTGGSDDDQVQPPVTTATSTTQAETPQVLLDRMPAGPMDGKDSWRLPVLVAPQSGVADGQVVTALGRGFEPGERVGVVMCAAEAAVDGVAACQLGVNSFEFVTYSNARSDGDVVVPVQMRRFITTPATGDVDCMSWPERCMVAVGAVSNYDRSGGSFVGFAGAPPFVEPTVVVEPPGPYVAGQVVTVRLAGLIPIRDVQVLECLDTGCLQLAKGDIADDGTFVTEVVLESALADEQGNLFPCGEACVLRVDGTGLRGATAGPMPPPVPLTFLPDGEVPASPPAPVVTEPIPPVVTEPVPIPSEPEQSEPEQTETLPPLSTTTTPTEPAPTEPAPTEPQPDPTEPLSGEIATTAPTDSEP